MAGAGKGGGGGGYAASKEQAWRKEQHAIGRPVWQTLKDQGLGNLDFSKANYDQVGKVMSIIEKAGATDNMTGNLDGYYRKASSRWEELAPQRRMEEYMMAMGEYMGMMAESLNKVEKAQSPIKKASQITTQQKSASQSAIDMRRGLLSQYNRFGTAIGSDLKTTLG